MPKKEGCKIQKLLTQLCSQILTFYGDPGNDHKHTIYHIIFDVLQGGQICPAISLFFAHSRWH